MRALPRNLKMYTLGGRQYGERNWMQPLCELAHMCYREFITPDQYLSIEDTPEIHRKNSLMSQISFRHSTLKPQYLPGDIERVVPDLIRQGLTRPAFVNLDLMTTALGGRTTKRKGGFSVLLTCLRALEPVKGKVVVGWNTVIRSSGCSLEHLWCYNPKEFPSGWHETERFEYDGAGEHHGTRMRTIVLLRE
jgi:hypothetical protein